MIKKKYWGLLLSLVIVLSFVQPLEISKAQNIPPDYIEYDYLTKTERTIPYDTVRTFVSTSSNLEERASNVRFTPEYTPPGLGQVDQIETHSIIGNDDRVRVNPNYSPYSRIVALRCGQDKNGDGIADSWSLGTGFMEGPDCLVTAGHCMWDKTYGWVEEMRAYPKQNSSVYGNTYYYPLSWTCSSEYTSKLNTDYDWCVVTMHQNLGDSLGWFGKGTGGSLINKSITVSGYPGDRRGYQYSAKGIIRSEDAFTCRYDADTMRGQSGSPVYSSNGIVWAIHTYGLGSINRGNKITNYLYDLLQEKYVQGINKWH